MAPKLTTKTAAASMASATKPAISLKWSSISMAAFPESSSTRLPREGLGGKPDGSKFPSQELGAALPERPVLVAVLHHRHHQVGRGDTASALQLFAEEPIEGFLLLLRAALARRHLHDDELVAPNEAKPGVLDDHVRARMLGDDLIAVALGHLERGEHGAMGGVEQ